MWKLRPDIAPSVTTIAAAEWSQLVRSQALPAWSSFVLPYGVFRMWVPYVVLLQQWLHRAALQAWRQSVLDDVKVPNENVVAPPPLRIPTVANSQVQVFSIWVCLEATQYIVHAPSCVSGVEERPNLLLDGYSHGLLENGEIIICIGAGEYKQDAFATSSHKHHNCCAINDTAIGDIKHARRPFSHKVIPRRLEDLPSE